VKLDELHLLDRRARHVLGALREIADAMMWVVQKKDVKMKVCQKMMRGDR
jgi:hypothetical protein